LLSCATERTAALLLLIDKMPDPRPHSRQPASKARSFNHCLFPQLAAKEEEEKVRKADGEKAAAEQKRREEARKRKDARRAARAKLPTFAKVR
jgi:hypothetical protein